MSRTWQELLDEAIAEEIAAREAQLGRPLTDDERAYAVDRARLRAPDDPASLRGRFAHGATLEQLDVEEERRPTPPLIPRSLPTLQRRRGRA